MDDSIFPLRTQNSQRLSLCPQAVSARQDNNLIIGASPGLRGNLAVCANKIDTDLCDIYIDKS